MFTENLITYCREIWDQCPDSFPLMQNAYSDGQKREREALFQEYSGKYKALQSELRLKGTKPDTTRFFKGLGIFLKNVYDFSDEALSLILHPDMVTASQSFYKEAKAFDPDLSREEIFQAMRNAWIMNGLQLMLGKTRQSLPPPYWPTACFIPILTITLTILPFRGARKWHSADALKGGSWGCRKWETITANSGSPAWSR